MGGFLLRVAAMALGLAGPALAQDAAPPPAAAAGCEFHVWPADALMSVYYGWFHGSTVNGQIMGRPGYPSVPPDPIATATQAAILAELQPQRLIGREDYRLIVHPEALPSRVIRANAGRLTESTSACYAELIVDDIVLQQGALSGSFLKVLAHYRDFGPDPTPRRSFATWSQSRLTVFPPSSPDRLEVALAEIRQAYRHDLALFAQAARTPPRRRR